MISSQISRLPKRLEITRSIICNLYRPTHTIHHTLGLVCHFIWVLDGFTRHFVFLHITSVRESFPAAVTRVRRDAEVDAPVTLHIALCREKFPADITFDLATRERPTADLGSRECPTAEFGGRERPTVAKEATMSCVSVS